MENIFTLMAIGAMLLPLMFMVEAEAQSNRRDRQAPLRYDAPPLLRLQAGATAVQPVMALTPVVGNDYRHVPEYHHDESVVSHGRANVREYGGVAVLDGATIAAIEHATPKERERAVKAWQGHEARPLPRYQPPIYAYERPNYPSEYLHPDEFWPHDGVRRKPQQPHYLGGFDPEEAAIEHKRPDSTRQLPHDKRADMVEYLPEDRQGRIRNLNPVVKNNMFERDMRDNQHLRVRDPNYRARLNAFDREVTGRPDEWPHRNPVAPQISPFRQESRPSSSKYNTAYGRAGRINQFSQKQEMPAVAVQRMHREYRSQHDHGPYVRQGVDVPTNTRITPYDRPVLSSDYRYKDRYYSTPREMRAFDAGTVERDRRNLNARYPYFGNRDRPDVTIYRGVNSVPVGAYDAPPLLEPDLR